MKDLRNERTTDEVWKFDWLRAKEKKWKIINFMREKKQQEWKNIRKEIPLKNKKKKDYQTTPLSSAGFLHVATRSLTCTTNMVDKAPIEELYRRQDKNQDVNWHCVVILSTLKPFDACSRLFYSHILLCFSSFLTVFF